MPCVSAASRCVRSSSEDVNTLSFILQRSFARYVAIDLMTAAQGLGWGTAWFDIEGRLLTLAGHPDAERDAGVEALADELQAARPHVVFSYGLEYLAPVFATVRPGDSRTLAGLLDRPAVYFLFDFGFPFDRPVTAETAPIIETLQGPDALVFCWDQDAVATAHRYGIRQAFHFMAVNPAIFPEPKQNETGHRDIPIVFAGGPTPERVDALRAVADLGLQIYGYDRQGWSGDEALTAAWRPALLERREMAAVYRRSRLAVNVTRPHGPSSLNMRVYEAMAAGCLMLTDDRADARVLFTPGEDLVVYRSPSDLRAQAERYLADDGERCRIARAGHARVLAEHTYAVRLGQVRDRIEAFVREALVHRKLRAYAAQDAAKALAFADYVEAHGACPAHPDAVAAVRARCLGSG